MSYLYCLVAVTLLWAKLEAIPTQTNVDVEEPAVIVSPATVEGDAFGWEAIFHQTSPLNNDEDDMSEALVKTRILVGAPRGSYRQSGLGLQDPELEALSGVGLVYNCPVQGDCVGVRGDTNLYIDVGDPDITNGFQTNPAISVNPNNFFVNAIAEGRLFDQAPNSATTPSLERKEGQLMGSVLYSSGDLVLACAPRWTTSLLQTDRTNLRDPVTGDFIRVPRSTPRGICFVGNRNLTGFKTFNPCTSRSSDDSFDSSDEGYCSAGFSAVITTDEIVHIAAPGFGSFGGTVFTRAFQNNFVDNFQSLGETFPEAVYLGFDMTLGYVRTMRTSNSAQGGPELAVSATRYDNSQNYNGRVYIYSVGTTNSAPSNELLQQIEGTQMAEFFGYSLALCDLNGDGYDELIVGAPMYSTLSPMVLPEQGRVYIFFNLGGTFDHVPVQLNGASAYSRFGFSVANVGDLDADGRQDLVIGAPYEVSSSTDNTGAVYVYYGKGTTEEFENQSPQKIHADTIVNQLLTSTLTMLRTFGFTLSGNVDVDNNRHSDFLVGSPEESVVVVLRSRPFVNLIVDVDPVEAVNLDVNLEFTVTVRARYNSASIDGSISIPFTLMEMLGEAEEPRLEAVNNIVAQSEFNFDTADAEISVTVSVTAMPDVSDLSPYRLQLDVRDIDRPSTPRVSGQQPVSDLSTIPRLRLQGNTTFEVEIIEPCDDDGCVSDVALLPIMPPDKRLVASATASSIQFEIAYMNNGPEEARDLRLNITDIPSRFFTGLSLTNSATNFRCQPLQITTAVDVESVQCSLQNRLRTGVTERAVLTLFLTSLFIGNEDDFTLMVEMLVNTEDDNRDDNTANNVQSIGFMVDSQANIGINLRFTLGSGMYLYSGVPPIPNEDGQLNSCDLGDKVTLSAEVTNSGPSVIQSARLMISFPAQSSITGSNYFLYPRGIDVVLSGRTNTNATCSETGLDPDDLDDEPPVQSINQRKRSISPMNIKNYRTRRSSVKTFDSEIVRHTKREALGLDCGTEDCVTFTCDIQMLTTAGLEIQLQSVVDERFYSSIAEPEVYGLNATASVSVLTDFQVSDDMISDNTAYANATISLRPDTDQDDGNLVHVILWPIIGGLIILVVLFILLYFVGFFRRKKKPGEDKIEGDFEPPEATEVKKAPLTVSYEKPTEEATTV